MHQQTNKGIKMGLKTFSSHIYWANIFTFHFLNFNVLGFGGVEFRIFTIIFLQAGVVEKIKTNSIWNSKFDKSKSMCYISNYQNSEVTFNKKYFINSDRLWQQQQMKIFWLVYSIHIWNVELTRFYCLLTSVYSI